MRGVQLGLANLITQREDGFSVQIGTCSQCRRKGIQIGLINNGLDNTTFQPGLININKNGILPVMIFVNFASDLFD